MKTYKVEQIKNENGTFTYLVDGVVYTKQSKRDYDYCLVEVGVFSSSLKTIQSQLSFWLKYGDSSINKENLFISEIVKN